MKRILLLTTIFAALFTSSNSIAEYSRAHNAVVSYFISNEEPSVKDAMWSTATTLKLGMLDNGSRRDGFADYACNILSEHGFKGKKITVHIINIRKLARENKWEKLGETRCD